MSAKATKVYPIVGHYLNEVPRAVITVPTREAADRLIASGAYTDNPRHPDRDGDAPDLSDEPVQLRRTSYFGEQPEDPTEAPPAPSDSTEE